MTPTKTETPSQRESGGGTTDSSAPLDELLNMFDSCVLSPAIVFCYSGMLAPFIMPSDMEGDSPLLQRLYDRIWLIAVLAILFWAISYVVWGYVDIWTIPPGVVA